MGCWRFCLSFFRELPRNVSLPFTAHSISVTRSPTIEMEVHIQNGTITLQSEEEIVQEQRLFLQCLNEMDSYYVNEHIINLLLEVRGNLLTEKRQMLSDIDRFLRLPPEERLLFAVGRRLNVFSFWMICKSRSCTVRRKDIWTKLRKKIPMWISHFCVTMCGNPKYKNQAQPYAPALAVPDFLLFSGWAAWCLHIQTVQIAGAPITHCFQNRNDTSAKRRQRVNRLRWVLWYHFP